MLGRGRLFQRPDASDSDDDDGPGGREIYAKPIERKLAAKLDSGFEGGYRPRAFVTASAKSQAEFYGNQHIASTSSEASTSHGTRHPGRPLNDDQKNKLSAKIIKAEMMGNQDLAKRLRAKLDSGLTTEEEGPKESTKLKGGEPQDVLLTRTDFRSGLTVPARTRERPSEQKTSNINELVREEKLTTSEDQLALFGGMNPTTASGKVDDDWTVDDVCLTKTECKKKKRDRAKKDEKRRREQAIRDYQRHQRTLDSCRLCVDSSKRQKHLMIAVGLKTYLCIPSSTPLVDGHCLIVPMIHCSSTVQLDEDVYQEMMIWRKGLVAMFAERDEDCVFMETAKNIRHQPHMQIECIPMPQEMADTVPIYFKKAILESDEEWAQNKKLIDLSKKDIRHSVPKGFSYFAVDFGLQSGFAHVIENESMFDASFGKEIIGGMLDLEHTRWRKPRKLDRDEQTKLVVEIKRMWRPFDWTERARAAIREQHEVDEQQIESDRLPTKSNGKDSSDSESDVAQKAASSSNARRDAPPSRSSSSEPEVVHKKSHSRRRWKAETSSSSDDSKSNDSTAGSKRRKKKKRRK